MNKNKKFINILCICFAIALIAFSTIMKLNYNYNLKNLEEELNFKLGNSGMWSKLIINDVNIADENINTFMLKDLEKMSQSLSKLKNTKNDTYINDQFQALVYTMTNNPESLQPYLAEILEICILLNDNYSDINAYKKIEELINSVSSTNP